MHRYRVERHLRCWKLLELIRKSLQATLQCTNMPGRSQQNAIKWLTGPADKMPKKVTTATRQWVFQVYAPVVSPIMAFTERHWDHHHNFVYMMTISYSKQFKSTMTIFFVLNIHKFQAAAPILADETTVQRWAVQFLLKLECGSTHASQINIVTHLCYNQICITQNRPVLRNPAIAPSPVFCAFFSFSRFFAMRGCIALALAV